MYVPLVKMRIKGVGATARLNIEVSFSHFSLTLLFSPPRQSNCTDTGVERGIKYLRLISRYIHDRGASRLEVHTSMITSLLDGSATQGLRVSKH